MPNIKSAKKRVKIIETKTIENSMIKSEYKTNVKKFEQAVLEGNKNSLQELFVTAVKSVDKAQSKNIIKKNTASRKKSALSKKLNSVIA
jgi:ribosomal protein S20